MKIRINKQRWNVYVLSDYKFKKHVNKEAWAVTFYNIKSDEANAREIYFNKRYFTKEVIIHELVHAYLAYQPTKSKLRRETFEEIFCEFMEKHFYAIGKHAAAIATYYKTHLY